MKIVAEEAAGAEAQYTNVCLYIFFMFILWQSNACTNVLLGCGRHFPSVNNSRTRIETARRDYIVYTVYYIEVY